MEKINGDANITAISATLAAHVPRFVYVSTVENNLPEFFLKGYFHGKRRTEEALLDAFPHTGVVLRPGFIHGTRSVPLGGSNSIEIPLWLVGKPMETIFSLPPIQLLRNYLPGMKAILAPPIARDTLAKVAVSAALGETSKTGILSIEDIVHEAS